MSRDSFVRTLGPEELEEWLLGMGVLPPLAEGDRETGIQLRLRDGVALCQLINRVRPGSVDEVCEKTVHPGSTSIAGATPLFMSPIWQIKPRRCSGDAEENILRFLQACTTLGIKKVGGHCSARKC